MPRINVVGWLVVFGAVVIWEALDALSVIDYDFVPPPSEIWVGLREIASDGRMVGELMHTLSVAVISASIAATLGVLGGALLGRSRYLRIYTDGTVDLLRSIPVVALMPVALLVWGPSEKSEIIVAAYAASWPILINTTSAVRSIHPRLFDTGKTLHLSRRQQFTNVVVPAAFPGILVGIRLGLVTALIVSIVAEMTLNPDGLGWALLSAQQALQPAQMWAWVVAAAALGAALNMLLVKGSQLALRRGPHVTEGRL